MAITFPRVSEVAVGDPVSARNLGQLSDAINARILSGLGDGAWRIVMYWLNAARQIRNPDPSFSLYPRQHEFFTTYQSLGPDQTWPDAGPGEAEGVNVSSFPGAYVYGNLTADVDDEPTRLVVDGMPISPADSPSAAWALGKLQRGAIDPLTGGVASPAATAAVAYGSLTRNQHTTHGASYGAFYPIPDAAGATCPDGTESLIISFTNVSTGAVTSYAGTCSDVSTDVAAVYRMPLGYYVVKYSGAVDYLPRSQYIEGPYTRGEHPMHTWGDHLPRIMAQFSAEFRGTTGQRQDELGGRPWLANAFNIAHFLTRPYYLAPARGTEIPGSGEVFATYPTGTLSSATGTGIAAGTRIGGTVKPEPGFGVVALYVETTGLSAPLTLQIMQGETVTGTVRVTEDDPDAILTLEEALTGDSISAVVQSQSQFGAGGGSIRVEWAELLDQKPGLNDLFVALRLGGCKLIDSNCSDGSGITDEAAETLRDSYSLDRCGACV